MGSYWPEGVGDIVWAGIVVWAPVRGNRDSNITGPGEG